MQMNVYFERISSRIVTPVLMEENTAGAEGEESGDVS